MVTTYAQAQEIAEDWINAGVPRALQREVRVREFDLGFVCWAVDKAEAPQPGTEVRLVISRDSGASTLWPPLPVNEVVRQFEELYGTPTEANPAGPAKPVPGAVEATSFLLSPPQWLQEAGAAAIAAENAKLGQRPAAEPEPAPAPAPESASARLTTPPASGRPAGDAPTMLAPPSPLDEGTPAPAAPAPSPGPSAPVPEGATLPLPEDFVADQPETSEGGQPDLAAAPPPPPGAVPVLLPPPPGYSPSVNGTPAGGTPAAGMPVPPPAIEHAATMLATPDSLPPMPAPAPAQASAGPGIEYAPTMLATDGPPGLMGLPGAPGPSGAPGGSAGLGRSGPSTPPPPPPSDLRGPGAGPAAAASGGRGAPTAPPPPPPAELRGPGDTPAPAAAATAAAPAAPGPSAAAADVAYQATQLAPAIELPGGGPSIGGPGMPPPVGAPMPGVPPVGYGYPTAGAPVGAPPMMAPPAVPVPPPAPTPPAAPVPPGVPVIGPGTQAVVSYRGPDGSEQTLIHRSEPGTPYPEWKALQDLRQRNVPPDQVLELHTDLELCDLPGGYCARMVKASWPNVRISHTVPYGRDQQSRQAGMAMLLDHLDQLHQLAAAPQRHRPVRVPLPPPGTVQQLPPVAPQQLAAELGQVFGPAVFRFEQRAVSRQGVPPQVAETLMWAGLPRDFAPFFWAQAQEGRPIPTLAELAAERGRPAAPDFGGYLVLGNDYGRQLCVQYGTAAVVAVDLEGSGEPPRFVNSGVPEFVRSLALLGRMWRLRYGLTPDQAARWTADFQAQLLAIDPAALLTPESWWGVLVEQFWDGLL